MGKTRRAKAAATDGINLYQLAIPKKDISKEEKKRAKKPRKALQRYNKRATATRLVNHLRGSFTIHEFREKFRRIFGAPCEWDANAYKNTLSSVRGVYAREKLHFVFKKTVKTSLFTAHCMAVAQAANRRKFSLNQFCDRFRKKYKCSSLPWDGERFDIKAFLQSIPQLETTEDGQFRMRSCKTGGNAKKKKEKKKKKKVSKKTEDQGLKSAVEVVVRRLSNRRQIGLTFEKVKQAYKFSGQAKRDDVAEIARITPEFLLSIHGIYSDKKTDEYFYYPKTVESGVFLKQCNDVVEEIARNRFTFKQFQKRFRETFTCGKLPWKGGTVKLLMSIPFLEKRSSKTFARVQCSSEEVVINQTEGDIDDEFGQNRRNEVAGEATIELSEVMSRSEDILSTLPVPFTSTDFYVAFFNKVCEPVPPIKKLGLSRERDLFLAFPRVYSDGHTDHYYYLPTAVDCGIFYDHCLFVWNRSPTRFGYHKFCRIFQEIFDVRGYPWLEKSQWQEILGSHPRMHMDEEGKYSLKPLTYDEENGVEREQSVQKKRTRDGDEHQRTRDSTERGLKMAREENDEIARGRGSDEEVPAERTIVKQEIGEDFIINRLVSEDDEPMETENTDQATLIAQTPKAKVVKRRRRTRKSSEINENASQRSSHDRNHVTQEQDEVLLPETSTAPSSKGTVVQVVVTMMEYAEKRGVDMDELTAAVLRTITDRL